MKYPRNSWQVGRMQGKHGWGLFEAVSPILKDLRRISKNRFEIPLHSRVAVMCVEVLPQLADFQAAVWQKFPKNIRQIVHSLNAATVIAKQAFQIKLHRKCRERCLRDNAPIVPSNSFNKLLASHPKFFRRNENSSRIARRDFPCHFFPSISAPYIQPRAGEFLALELSGFASLPFALPPRRDLAFSVVFSFRFLPRFKTPFLDRNRKCVAFMSESADQFFVSNSLPENVSHRCNEAARIAVLVLPFIEAEHLLADIAEQVAGFDAHIRSLQRPLEQRPEVFQAVRVDVIADVFNGMVNRFVRVIHANAVINHRRIREHFRAPFDVGVKRFGGFFRRRQAGQHLRHYLGNGLVSRGALQQAHHGRLSHIATHNDATALLDGLVHVDCAASDKGFIGLNRAAHFRLHNGTARHREADTMQHEPRGFLCHPQRPRQLARRNPVLRVHDAPHGRQPLVQAKGRVFKDRPDLDRELLGAALALPELAGGEKSNPVIVTPRAANCTGRPAHRNHESQGNIRVPEVFNRFNQRLGKLGKGRVHGLKVARNRGESSIYLPLEFATKAHEGQKRKYTGEPYIEHPKAVAAIVERVPHTDEMIAAALLHDVVEDCGVLLLDILDLFGTTVAELVENLTDISRPSDGNRAKRKAMDLAHMALSCPQAKTIKLADLLDNTKDIEESAGDFAKVYMREKAALLEVLKEGDSALWSECKHRVEEFQARNP